MILDPTTYHRMRFEAALMVYQEAEAAPVEDMAAWDKGVWFRADAFLAAGGYECQAEAEAPYRETEDQPEPTPEEWLKAWHCEPGDPDPATFLAGASHRAHELARQRSAK